MQATQTVTKPMEFINKETRKRIFFTEFKLEEQDLYYFGTTLFRYV